MRCILVLMCVAGLLLQVVGASAIPAPGPITVTATAGGKVATKTFTWTNGVCFVGPIDLKAADGTVLGRLNNLSAVLGADPFVTLNFGVQAVGAANFLFDTGEFAFATIDPAMAFATAATTLTTDGNGGTFTGNFAGGKAYQATYNGGTLFAGLDGTFAGPAFDSTTETERNPAAGFSNIVGPVSTIRGQWNFSLSDGDGASGTSRFQVEPVPDASTLALAFTGVAPLLAGFALRRRKSA